MFVNGTLAKLGKKPVVLDRRQDSTILQFGKYRLRPLGKPIPNLPTSPPAEVSWITKLAEAQALPMYLNDQLGCCVEAAAGHMIQQWSFYAGKPVLPADADILKAYEDVGGYVPGDPNTDNGTDMLQFLNYWQSTGVGGHKILAYMAVDWTNADEVQDAIDIFGNLYTGVALPVSCQGANDWTVPDGGIYGSAGQPGGWGGHCIPFVASSPITKTCLTWGSVLKASHNFFADYVDEAFVVLSQDWIEANGLSPSLLDLAQLEADLGQFKVHLNVTAIAK
jgi:hypothetical protein